MALKFLLTFGRFNLSYLPEDQKKEVIKKTGITITKAVVLFEYGKANKGYWDVLKLH